MVEQNWNMMLALPEDRSAEFYLDVVGGQMQMREYNEYTNVLLFAQEKSGSNHVHELLCRTLGLRDHPTGFNRKNTYLYYPRVLAAKYIGANTISRSHTHNSMDVSRMIRNLDMRPLVLTRSLLDALVSRRDHVIRTEPGDDIHSEKEWVKYLRGSSEYQLDYVIERFANLHIEFYNSWDAYVGNVLRITWDEMVSDPVGMVDRVAEWLGLEVIEDVKKITEMIKASGGANFNRGIAGRGREEFNERQIAEIMRRADILGCTDIGE